MCNHFHLFGEPIYAYQVMLILGIIAALITLKVFSTITKLDSKIYDFYNILALLSILAGLVSALLFDSFYKFFQTGEFKIQGVTFMGGLLGGVACFVGLTALLGTDAQKNEFWTVANIGAFCIAIAHCFGRIGCFLAGCCYGVETNSVFGLQFPNLANPVYPTQLYEAIFLGLMFLAMLPFRKRQPFLIYLFSYGIFRFLIEFIRGDNRGAYLFGILSPSQVQSIIMLIAAGILTILVCKYKIIPFKSKKPIAKTQARKVDL